MTMMTVRVEVSGLPVLLALFILCATDTTENSLSSGQVVSRSMELYT